MRRILWLAAAAILVLPAASRCQQDQQASQTSGQSSAAPAPAPAQESLADAARKAREQKKEAPKAAKVFTNEDLPSAGGVSTVGQAPAPAEGAAAVEAAAAPAQGKAASEEAWKTRFADLRHKLDQDKAELDVLQREAATGMVQYYGGDPQKANQDQQSGQALGADYNKKKSAIDAKRKAVDADQKAIDDAMDELRKSGGDPGWAR